MGPRLPGVHETSWKAAQCSRRDFRTAPLHFACYDARAKSKTKSRSPRANPHVDNYEREELCIRAIPQQHYFYFCFALVAGGRARSLTRNERSSAANAISHRTVRIPTTVPVASAWPSRTSPAPSISLSSGLIWAK